MAIDINSLALPGVRGLHPYQPGKPIAELARELGLAEADIIKLASNENPLGPSPRALAAIDANGAELARYPDGNGFALKAALSERLNISPDQITLGNGSSDALEFVVRAFAGPGLEVVYSEHAFAMYPIVTQATGATGVSVPARDWGHDLDAMRKAVTDQTRVVFIANPNNPTGTWLAADALEAFVASLPDHVICVIDEAYFEYVAEDDYPDCIAWLARHPNIMVTRTFSKIYGLAGLRVGYGVASAALTDMINRIRPPFNVNSIALGAATAALADEAHVTASRKMNHAGLAQLANGFSELGVNYIPSVGNFISFVTSLDGNALFDGLLRQGVIVRPVGNYGMPNYLRVTVGTAEENTRFLKSLGDILGA